MLRAFFILKFYLIFFEVGFRFLAFSKTGDVGIMPDDNQQGEEEKNYRGDEG
jgi:hypothetical protein